MVARDADFLGGGGTLDPFTGIAPGMTPEEQAANEEARRRSILTASARNTANINNAPGGYASQRAASDQDALQTSDRAVYADRRARGFGPEGNQRGLLGNLVHDPVTMGILAAPYAALGAGAALGGAAGLGFGEGAAVGGGTLAGTSAGMPAGIQAVGAPSTIASPFAAGAGGAAGAGAVGAAGGAAAAAAPSFLESAGSWAQGAVPQILGAAAPILIAEAMGGKTKEEKALIAKQEQMAQEAQRRQGQQQDQRMNQLGQQLLAFDPTNQMLAQAFGPQAAFRPEQMAALTAGTPPPSLPPDLINYQGTDPQKQAQVEEWIRRKQEFDKAEASRRDMMMSGTTPVGPGPAPMQMPAPQAARRY